MRKNKLVRTVGIAALIVLALGGVGFAVGGNESNDAASLVAPDGAPEDGGGLRPALRR